MAKQTIMPAQPDGGGLGYYQEAILGVHWQSKAVYYDVSGFQYIIEGKGFRYDGQEMTRGVISSVTLKDPDGGTWYTITGARTDASKLPDLSEFYWADKASQVILSGKDTIIGSSGEDFLNGGNGRDIVDGKAGNDQFDGSFGNDRLTGGKGDDEFFFRATTGHDVITDFKRNGDHDVIHVPAEYEAMDTRDGVLITFGEDMSVLLEGLRLKDLDPGDINPPD